MNDLTNYVQDFFISFYCSVSLWELIWYWVPDWSLVFISNRDLVRSGSPNCKIPNKLIKSRSKLLWIGGGVLCCGYIYFSVDLPGDQASAFFYCDCDITSFYVFDVNRYACAIVPSRSSILWFSRNSNSLKLGPVAGYWRMIQHRL